MPEIDRILGAINLANHENVKELTVPIEDLLLLRSSIKELTAKVKLQHMENSMLTCKLANRPIGLDTYKRAIEEF